MSRRSKKLESTASSMNRRTPRTSGNRGGAACTSSLRCCSRIETKLLAIFRNKKHENSHHTLHARACFADDVRGGRHRHLESRVQHATRFAEIQLQAQAGRRERNR